jgi:hypothetical protein
VDAHKGLGQVRALQRCRVVAKRETTASRSLCLTFGPKPART